MVSGSFDHIRALRVVFMMAWMAIFAGSSLAADAVSTTKNVGKSRAATNQRFATVVRLDGEVTAKAPGAVKGRALQVGDAIFVGEQISTAKGSETLFKTDDASLISMRPSTSFVAERFEAQGQASDVATFRLLGGGLRIVTGWIGKLNRADYRVVTNTATIGIRGTDYEPFVVTPELADETLEPEGTYNKVNRGGTTVDVSGNKLDVEPGRIAFARKAHDMKGKRALMTLLLPTLLTRVPNFYVPGRYDAELDQLSPNADAEALRQLEEVRKAKVPVSTNSEGAGCVAANVAQSWLSSLDSAISRRDAQSVAALFQNGLELNVSARQKGGSRTSLAIGREEFIQSAIAALDGLSDYRHRRPVVKSGLSTTGDCGQIWVKSTVVEQGTQNGKPFRFNSTEEFVLKLQGGKWIAIAASVQQN
jgi:hypothetical protein